MLTNHQTAAMVVVVASSVVTEINKHTNMMNQIFIMKSNTRLQI